MYTHRIELRFSPEYAVNVSIVLHTEEDGKLYIDATVSRNLMTGSAQLHELRREYNLVAASSFINTALYAMNVSHIKAAKIITQVLAVHKTLYGELTSGN
jgi:hypothetical protein